VISGSPPRWRQLVGAAVPSTREASKARPWAISAWDSPRASRCWRYSSGASGASKVSAKAAGRACLADAGRARSPPWSRPSGAERSNRRSAAAGTRARLRAASARSARAMGRGYGLSDARHPRRSPRRPRCPATSGRPSRHALVGLGGRAGRSVLRHRLTACRPADRCGTDGRAHGRRAATGLSPRGPRRPVPAAETTFDPEPHRRRHLLSDHPAPPPQRVDHRRFGRAAAPGRAGRLRPHARPAPRAPGRWTGAPPRHPPAARLAGQPGHRRKQDLKHSMATEATGIALAALPAPASTTQPARGRLCAGGQRRKLGPAADQRPQDIDAVILGRRPVGFRPAARRWRCASRSRVGTEAAPGGWGRRPAPAARRVLGSPAAKVAGRIPAAGTAVSSRSELHQNDAGVPLAMVDAVAAGRRRGSSRVSVNDGRCST
jgi:hypothetical protein